MKRKARTLLAPVESTHKMSRMQKDYSEKGEHSLRTQLPEAITKFDELLERFKFEYASRSQAAASEGVPAPSASAPPSIEEDSRRSVDQVKSIALSAFTDAKQLLLSNPDDLSRKLETLSSAPEGGAPAARVVPANHTLVALLNELRALLVDSLDVISNIKMWIQLSIPKIEDGNNFGVSIQEDCVEECIRTEDLNFNLLETAGKTFADRGDLLSKCLKNPLISDYYLNVLEYDRMQQCILYFGIKDLRNHYAILHDMIMKNIDKIRRPRAGV